MRAVETTPAAPLKAVTDEELSSGARPRRAFEERPGRPLKRKESAQLGIHQTLPVWLISLIPHVSHVSRQINYARSEGQSSYPAERITGSREGIVRSEDEMYDCRTCPECRSELNGRHFEKGPTGLARCTVKQCPHAFSSFTACAVG